MTTAEDTDEPSAHRRPLLGTVAGLNALAAWGGAIALLLGAIDFGATLNSRLPFESLTLAGVALALVVAVPLTVLAWSAWTSGPRTEEIALVAGGLLIGWICVQIAVLRTFSLFQPVYLGVGIYFVAASRRIRLGRNLRGVLLLGLGVVLLAVGVGLVPHLVKAGFTVMSVVSVVLLAGGLAVVGLGGRDALGERRLPARITGGVATLVVLALAVSVISPAVAATTVPASEVTRMPAMLGLDHEAVTLRTSDGVDLAAWYLPGGNGAGVVMLHGAGSTRSAVLDQAEALVATGYSVLLVDARGHGDSGGAAMDFGWFGDQDVAAGTEFLASREEVDPGRIGVVGFSMGGEEAIGAAATDPRIRAVVAEGATARTAADKAWFSDVYGWRGWFQRRIEAVQYGIADFLTEASPPIPLRAAVASSEDTEFLLITAGDVEDEGHAAAFVRSDGGDRVVVWDVAGSGHTRGFATDPDEWTQRVTTFLDDALR